MLTFAISFITLACVLYTIGVWAEKLKKRLLAWHVCIFWGGFICDTLGTGAMERIAGGLFQVNFHGITGLLAVLLMLFHTIWATTVIVKKNEKMKESFHKISIIVWIIWMIPMVLGIIMGTTI